MAARVVVAPCAAAGRVAWSVSGAAGATREAVIFDLCNTHVPYSKRAGSETIRGLAAMLATDECDQRIPGAVERAQMRGTSSCKSSSRVHGIASS
jgi:hypothetical protein